MGNFHPISKGHINHVNKDSGEDTMVATLLFLKAQELSGQIADSVAHRVNIEIAKIKAGCKE